MYLALGKLPCTTCVLEDEDDIQGREARIEIRRARIEAKILAAREEEALAPQEEVRPKSPTSSYSSSFGSTEDGEENEEGDEQPFPPVPALPENELDGEGLPATESSSESEVGDADDPFYEGPELEADDASDPYKESFVKEKEQSRRNVSLIMRDGETWITNVKVAAECREFQRRERVKSLRKERFEKLRQEAAECARLYKELEEGWNIKAEKILPLELYEKIQEHQRAADRVLERKDIQIDELRSALDETDWEFEEVLGFYQKDIMLMGDRIDEHMDALFASFLNELTLVEEHVETEESEMLAEYEVEWEEMMTNYEKAERESLEERQEQALDRFATMGEKYESAKEEMRQLRHQLEDDYRTLVLLFENYKFASLLNTEKLDYNLKVVRRREVENLKMRSSLKRAVLKFGVVLNSLRDEFASVVGTAKREAKEVIKEANRLQEQNSKTMRTLLHMVRVDYSKFMDCWLGAEEEGRRRINLLLDIQEFVFQRMLGLSLPKTDLSVLDLRPKEVQTFIYQLDYDEEMQKADRGDPAAWGRKTADSSQSQGLGQRENGELEVDWSATVAGSKPEAPFSASSQPVGKSKRLKQSPSFQLEWSPSLNLLPEPETDPLFQKDIVKKLGKVIGEETGFLLEDKLRKMLAPMMKSERELVQFDAVLSALGIQTLGDMQLLTRYMIRHCTVMKGILAKWDDASTPLLESMQVSLDEIPSNYTSVDTVALERLNLQISRRLLEAEIEEADEAEVELKPLLLPRILYCDELQPAPSVEDSGEIQGEVAGERSDVALDKISSHDSSSADMEAEGEGSDETRISHSAGSMDTPEGCRRRTLTFKTDESMVMTWYKASSNCRCEKEGGVCICDLSDGVKEKEAEELMAPETGTSEAESASDTASIPSLATSSVGSEEFLYIPPNDVLRALAGFLREFNAKTKLVKPTIQEIVTQKLSKLRFPSSDEMREYWAQYLPLAQHFDTDGFWESLLQIFSNYHVMLKERNKILVDVKSIGKQNEELAGLLRAHMVKFGLPELDLNRLTLPYCQQ